MPQRASRPRGRSRARAPCPEYPIRRRGVLGHADGGQRVRAQLVEAEFGRHRERRFGAQPAPPRARPAISRMRCGEGEDSSRAAETDSPASSSARARCRPTPVLAAVPEHAREEGLGLGRRARSRRRRARASRASSRAAQRRASSYAQWSASARRNSSSGRSGRRRGQSASASSYCAAATGEAVEGERAIACGPEREPRAFGDARRRPHPLARTSSSAELQW